MSRTVSPGDRRRQASWFLVACFGWTWGWWSIPLVAGADIWSAPWVWTLYLGGAGPCLAGLAATARFDGRGGLLDLVRRLVDVRRPGGWGWLMALGLPPTIAGAAWLWAAASSGWVIPDQIRPGVSSAILWLGFMLLLGPLPEEIGWRGFALGRLQAWTGAVAAPLVLGLIWAAWHVPLFFLVGYYQRFGSPPDPIRFVIEILAVSVLIAGLYDRTGRSLMAAVLFHFMVNVSGELFPVGGAAGWLKTALLAMAALVWMFVGWVSSRRGNGAAS